MTATCRFCGGTDQSVLVEDFNPGEPPFVYCAPWCTGTMQAPDMRQTRSKGSRSAEQPVAVPMDERAATKPTATTEDA